MVSTSCGSSILFTASTFFGSADNPLSLQGWPKKESFGILNYILSGFNVKLFFLHTSKKFRFPSCSLLIFPYIIMSSAIPVTPGTLTKITSSFLWKTFCAMMETIGSLIHWKCPMSNAIFVNFLDSGCSFTIQYPLLNSAIVNWIIPWNFPSISLTLLV